MPVRTVDFLQKDQLFAHKSAPLEWLVGTVEAILKGEKPPLDPNNPNEAWLLSLMRTMFDEQLLVENAECHFTFPTDTSETLMRKGDVQCQPLTFHHQAQHKKTISDFQRQKVTGVFILGSDPKYRQNIDNPWPDESKGKIAVLDRTDLWGLHQALSLIIGANQGRELPFSKLVILESNGFYKDLVGFLGSDPAFQDCRLDIIIAPTIYDAVIQGALAKSAQDNSEKTAENLSAHPGRHGPRAIVSAGDVILFYSSGEHKRRDFERTLDALEIPVSFSSFTGLFPGVRSAEEESYSYVGNIHEKLVFLRNRVALEILCFSFPKLSDWKKSGINLPENINLADLYSPDFEDQMRAVQSIVENHDLRQRILSIENIRAFGEKHHLNVFNTSIMLDDSGLDVDPDLPVPESVRVRVPQANPVKPWPGTELAHYLTSMPLPQIVHEIIKAYEAVGRPAIVINRSTAAIIPLVSLLTERDLLKACLVVSGSVKQEMVYDPRRFYPTSNVTFDHFLKPLEGNPDGKLASEIPDYAQRSSPRAIVTLAMVNAADLASGPFKVAHEFRRVVVPGSIATQYTLLQEMRGHGAARAQKCIKGGLRSKIGEGRSGGFLSGNNPRHNFQGAAARSPYQNPLSCISNILQDADVFLCMPHDEDGMTQPMRDRVRLASFAFRQAVQTAIQIGDSAVKGKVTLEFLPKTAHDDVSMAQKRFLDPMEKAGVRGHLPAELIPVVSSQRTVRKRIADARRILPITESMIRRPTIERGQKLTVPDSMYVVTLYGSASWQAPEDYERERQLSFTLAALGFAVKSGGGKVALMGAFNNGYDGYRDLARKLWGENAIPHDLHLSSIQCHQTQIKEGLYESADRTVIYSNIQDREWDLIQNDATWQRWGGDGTLEEAANDWLCRDLGYVTHDRPYIVDTAPLKNGCPRFEGLDQYLSRHFYTANNIHFIDNDLRGIMMLLSDRQRRGKAISLDHLAHIVPHLPKSHLLNRLLEAHPEIFPEAGPASEGTLALGASG